MQLDFWTGSKNLDLLINVWEYKFKARLENDFDLIVHQEWLHKKKLLLLQDGGYQWLLENSCFSVQILFGYVLLWRIISFSPMIFKLPKAFKN